MDADKLRNRACADDNAANWPGFCRRRPETEGWSANSSHADEGPPTFLQYTSGITRRLLTPLALRRVRYRNRAGGTCSGGCTGSRASAAHRSQCFACNHQSSVLRPVKCLPRPGRRAGTCETGPLIQTARRPAPPDVRPRRSIPAARRGSGCSPALPRHPPVAGRCVQPARPRLRHRARPRPGRARAASCRNRGCCRW